MNPQSKAIPGPMHTKQTFNAQVNTNHTQTAPNSRGAVTGCSIFLSKILSIRSQVLGPIKRPLTASFNRNISKTFKMGIKLKLGENPTSRSLKKLPKSGTHAKPSSRKAFLLLLPKAADGRISRYSREKCSLSPKALQKWSYWIPNTLPHVFVLAFEGEEELFAILSFSDLKSNLIMTIMSLFYKI